VMSRPTSHLSGLTAPYSVACEPLGSKVEAAAEALQRGLGDGNFLEHPARGIALAKALVSRTAEHRMIRYLVLDAVLAKPSIGQIDLHLSAYGARLHAESACYGDSRQSDFPDKFTIKLVSRRNARWKHVKRRQA